MARSFTCGMAILLLGGSVGCGRTVETPSPGAQEMGPDGGSIGEGDAGEAPPQGPEGGPAVGCLTPPSPLRRLTAFEINGTLRDLLADDSRPADALYLEPTNDADALQSFPVNGYLTIVRDLAEKITRDAAAMNALTGCDAAQIGETACKRKFIDTFIPKALRRALDPIDSADFDSVFDKGHTLGGDFASGVRAVLEVALQSPEFLYRVELGDPSQAKWTRPTPYEMATRLSYLLWGSAPDAALRDAAAQSKLGTKDDIAAQARRLLADHRAHDRVVDFYLQFLHISPFYWAGHELDATRSLPPDLSQLLLQETTHFVDDVTFQGPGTFHQLMTAPFTWTNGPLAKFYGIDGVTGDAFQRVGVDAKQRGGILTQGIFLTATSHTKVTSPIQRGKWVLEQMLCSPVPPPPLTPAIFLPDPLPNTTTRQRLEMLDAPPNCSPCHRIMDPIGFAFEHYDPVGLWRDTENGLPIDASGEILSTDAMGKFNGALELSAKLSNSGDAQNCFIGQWMTFAYGRKETPEDECSRRVLRDSFDKSKGNIIELIVALTQTDAFLYRPAKD